MCMNSEARMQWGEGCPTLGRTNLQGETAGVDERFGGTTLHCRVHLSDSLLYSPENKLRGGRDEQNPACHFLRHLPSSSEWPQLPLSCHRRCWPVSLVLFPSLP